MRRGWRKFLITSTICATCLILVALAVGTYTFGSPELAFAYARGYDFVLDDPVIELGECDRDEVREVAFRFVNLKSTPLKIVGASTSCNCVVTEGLPLQVPPRSTVSIPVQVHLKANDPDFLQTVSLYVGDEQLFVCLGEIRAGDAGT